jgi:hypothetical protein
MTSWMPIDCLSIFPMDFLIRQLFEPDAAVSAGSSSKLARLARIARFMRLFRLTKLANVRKFAAVVTNFLKHIGFSQNGIEFIGRIAFLAAVVMLVTHVGESTALSPLPLISHTHLKSPCAEQSVAFGSTFLERGACMGSISWF